MHKGKRPHSTPSQSSVALQREHEAHARKQARAREFYQIGAEWVQNYTIGDLYLNAWDAADKAGFTEFEAKVFFVEGYLSNLPRTVELDGEGKIVRIVHRSD